LWRRGAAGLLVILILQLIVNVGWCVGQETYTYRIKLYDRNQVQNTGLTRFYIGPYYIEYEAVYLGGVKKADRLLVYNRTSGRKLKEVDNAGGYNPFPWYIPSKANREFVVNLTSGGYDSEKKSDYVNLLIYDSIYKVEYKVETEITPSRVSLRESGEEAEIKIIVRNAGTTPLDRVEYKLILPASGEVALLSGAPLGATALDVGESITLEYRIKVITQTTPYATYLMFIVSYMDFFSVTGTGMSEESYIISIEVGEKRTVVEKPNVFAKVIPDSIKVKPGERVSISFHMENRGRGVAVEPAITVWAKPSDLKLVFVNPQLGEVTGYLSEPIYLINETTGEHADLLPGWKIRPLKFIAQIPPTVTTARYTIYIGIEYSDLEGDYYNQTYTVIIDVVEPGKPLIDVSKVVSSLWTGVGGELSITVTVKNRGDGVALNVKVVDDFPSQYFTLVKGETKMSIPKLNPGEEVEMTYRLKATTAGNVLIGRAVVEYMDEAGGKYIEESNEAGMVSIVEPDVRVNLIEKPDEVIITNRIYKYRFEVVNMGNGPAKKVRLLIKLPKGLDVYLQGGPVELTEGNILKFEVEEMAPYQKETITVTLRPFLTGNFSITQLEGSYMGPGEAKQYEIVGNVSIEFMAVVPESVRMFHAGMLVVLVVLSLALVLAALRAGGRTRRRYLRGRLGY